ncbi:MAG: MBL fold metallo-hydrolase [Flavobacteriales bacterium]|nr:MBL fold metallo-hydrolase [Flavobacteriales bacterium]
MKITFVNHSGFIIEYGGKRIMCDPWMEGAVFNNGWKLYAPTLFSYDDFKGIDYIWFSHEHPDHFYPPNLNKIDPEHRKDITILFQNTIDKRVKSYCTKSGFKDVVELQKNTYFEVTHSFELMCEHFQEGDSWIHFKTPEMSILNTNDCGITSIADAKKIINKVGHVDVLMTQFSYAYWAGNPEDLRHRQKVANDKLAGLQFQCEQFRPSVVMPIASYIYFCHEENQYLNDSINTPSKTYEYIKKM